MPTGAGRPGRKMTKLAKYNTKENGGDCGELAFKYNNLPTPHNNLFYLWTYFGPAANSGTKLDSIISQISLEPALPFLSPRGHCPPLLHHESIFILNFSCSFTFPPWICIWHKESCSHLFFRLFLFYVGSTNGLRSIKSSL